MIVDSERLKLEAFGELYADQSQEVVNQVIGYLKDHAGISRVVKILHCHREFLGTALTDEEHKNLCDAYAAIVEEKVFTCPEIAGATNFLQTFQDKSRFLVVSGTPEGELRRITKHRNLDSYFEEIYGSPRLKDVIVNEVLKRGEIFPGECLFVGDAMTDYRAALATSVPFIGRVDKGEIGPFPDGTKTVCDLNALAEVLSER